jgi:hypothetical protein
MTAETVESRTWSPLKWAVVVTTILALQTGFFFWFTRPPGLTARTRPATLSIRLPDGQPADLLGYINPSVLVRVNSRGFSGQAWLQIPPVAYNPVESNPPPFLLQLQADHLGDAVTQALTNSLSQPFEVAARPAPRFDNYSPSPLVVPTESTLSIEGELAGRPLLARPVLKLQPADTILTNTVVDVVVDGEGRVFAPPVLDPASSPRPAESAGADADALTATANLLFQPLPRVPGRSRLAAPILTPGRVVFHWQTIPTPTATNDTAAAR